jgi:arylsulfatase A-like enzyme
VALPAIERAAVEDSMRIEARVLLALAAFAVAPAAAAGERPPHVLILTVDTLRADRLSSYGYGRPTSPHLDRLIGSGVRFAHARTVEPLTTPALCSMLTSTHPHQHGASRNGLRMRPGLPSLPKTLAKHGYRTAAFVGNWTLRDRLSNLAEHFETYEEVLNRKRWFGLVSSETSADDLTQVASDFLEAHLRTSDRPVLLWVHYVDPHAPYRKHQDFLGSLGITDGKVRPEDRYDTEIAFVDRAIGRLLARFEELGALDDAIVAFTSDHGESLGEHNYWGHGRHLYESGLHIPMSIAWSGKLGRRTIEAPALNIDLPATILGLLGIEQPADFVGHDWTPVLVAGAAPPEHRVTMHQAHRGAVLSRHDSDLVRRAGLLEVALVRDRTKEVFRVQNGQPRRYALGQPGELETLIEAEAGPTAELQDWMRTVWRGLTDLDDMPPEPLDEESVEQLRSLGYAD